MTSILDKIGEKLGPLMKHSDLMVVFALFGVVMLLVFPIPAGLLDVLLAMSICVALLTLMIVIYLKNPAEFSVFPTLLLGITLFRLGLNVASTRLILGSNPPDAGNVIAAFGDFVVQGNYVVGAVIFLILVIINFVVITKGAGRIAEVAARFTLDAMPGKQMAIDAELNAGMIDEATASKRREDIQKEADFYGSMDGASKFVRGDAVAGIIITFINIIGGITIGIFQKDLPMEDALQTYTLLSIGDGLVTQVPALIVSVGAGILVTRTSDESDLGRHLSRQLVVYPRAIAVVAVMLGIFAVIPGMPGLPFSLLAAIAGIIAYFLHKHGPELQAAFDSGGGAMGDAKALPSSDIKSLPDGGGDADGSASAGSPQDIKSMIHVDIFAVEMGYGLISLADTNQGGDLLERITGLRHKIARDLGIIIPPIAVRDNLELDNNEYCFRLRNKEVIRGTLIPNRWMAMNVSGSTADLKGVPTVEPVFKLDAVWIPEEERKHAEMNGYTVIDPASVMITHLSEMLKDSAHLILEREDVQSLIEMVKERNPTLISELLPDLVSVGLIQRILQNLLKEKVSVKNLTQILETIADYAQATKNPDDLSEQVRKRLGVYFVEEYESEPGKLKALTIEPKLEQLLVSRVKRTQFEVGLMMDPQLTESLLQQLHTFVDQMIEQGLDPVILTTSELRLPFRRFFEPTFPRLAVLAYQEVPNNTQIENIGIVAMDENVAQQMTHQLQDENQQA